MNEEKKKALLSKMESIIGNSCYNGNIQNWGPNGEWHGEGRGFRYPITFLDDGTKKDKRYMTDIKMDLLRMRTGYYAFGANHLNIIQGLEEIINMLESNYKLSID